jgi:hypothetical protein
MGDSQGGGEGGAAQTWKPHLDKTKPNPRPRGVTREGVLSNSGTLPPDLQGPGEYCFGAVASSEKGTGSVAGAGGPGTLLVARVWACSCPSPLPRNLASMDKNIQGCSSFLGTPPFSRTSLTTLFCGCRHVIVTWHTREVCTRNHQLAYVPGGKVRESR